jgi:hypothetical protein
MDTSTSLNTAEVVLQRGFYYLHYSCPHTWHLLMFVTTQSELCPSPLRIGLTTFTHVHIIAKTKYLLRRVCLSVRSFGTTRLPLKGFSRNLVFEYFSKICQESYFINIWQEWRVLYMKGVFYMRGTLHEGYFTWTVCFTWRLLYMKGTLHKGYFTWRVCFTWRVLYMKGTLHEGCVLHEGYFTWRVLHMKGTLHEGYFT